MSVVVLEDELNKTVAKPADAVKEDNVFAFGFLYYLSQLARILAKIFAKQGRLIF